MNHLRDNEDLAHGCQPLGLAMSLLLMAMMIICFLLACGGVYIIGKGIAGILHL